LIGFIQEIDSIDAKQQEAAQTFMDLPVIVGDYSLLAIKIIAEQHLLPKIRHLDNVNDNDNDVVCATSTTNDSVSLRSVK
jgi:hypothetical protein